MTEAYAVVGDLAVVDGLLKLPRCLIQGHRSSLRLGRLSRRPFTSGDLYRFIPNVCGAPLAGYSRAVVPRARPHSFRTRSSLGTSLPGRTSLAECRGRSPGRSARGPAARATARPLAAIASRSEQDNPVAGAQLQTRIRVAHPTLVHNGRRDGASRSVEGPEPVAGDRRASLHGDLQDLEPGQRRSCLVQGCPGFGMRPVGGNLCPRCLRLRLLNLPRDGLKYPVVRDPAQHLTAVRRDNRQAVPAVDDKLAERLPQGLAYGQDVRLSAEGDRRGQVLPS